MSKYDAQEKKTKDAFLNKAVIGQASNMAHNEFITLQCHIEESLREYMLRRVPMLVKILKEIQDNA